MARPVRDLVNEPAVTFSTSREESLAELPGFACPLGRRFNIDGFAQVVITALVTLLPHQFEGAQGEWLATHSPGQPQKLPVLS
jgi:hypothetical protein